MNATLTASSAVTPDVDQAGDQAKVWEVRTGSNGHGLYLFDVYTTDMGEARKAVENVAKFLPWALAGLLFQDGFTVHQLRPGQERTRSRRLGVNFLAEFVPAPDYIDG